MPSLCSCPSTEVGHLIREKCIYLFGIDKLSGFDSVDSPGHCGAQLPLQRTRRKTHTRDEANLSQTPLSRPHIYVQEKSVTVHLSLHNVLFSFKKSVYIPNKDSQIEIMSVSLTILEEMPKLFFKIHLKAAIKRHKFSPFLFLFL